MKQSRDYASGDQIDEMNTSHIGTFGQPRELAFVKSPRPIGRKVSGTQMDGVVAASRIAGVESAVWRFSAAERLQNIAGGERSEPPVRVAEKTALEGRKNS